MSFAPIAAYASEWEYVTGIEDFVLTPREPSSTTVASVKGRRRDLSKAAMQTIGVGVGIEPQDIVIVLWKSTLSGETPVQGDTLTDGDGVVFVIQSLVLRRWATQWHCICRRQV